jgi:glycosyltransferase involved in cell wall biosynthesis
MMWLHFSVWLGAILSNRRLKKGRIRSLWGVTPILTLPLKAKADQELGIRSETAVWTTYIISQNFTWNMERVEKRFSEHPEFMKAFGRLVLGLALLRYDIFHYFNDRGFLWQTRQLGLEPEELDILKRSGKRVYVFSYGADVTLRNRTMALGQWTICKDCPEPGRFCICDDERGLQQIYHTTTNVTATVAFSMLKSCMPGAQDLDFWPIDLAKIAPPQGRDSNSALIVAHAPNHSYFKGTVFLQEAVAKLQAEGHAIRLSLISGVPNSEVMKFFYEADVVADQFVSGGYGYTSLEAMACGKPVLAYMRSTDLVFAPEDCPIIQTRPETVYNVLKWCLLNRERLPAIGLQGRVYVDKHHTIQAVAGRFASLYERTGDFPAEVVAKWREFTVSEAKRSSNIPSVKDWAHPFQMTKVDALEKSFNEPEWKKF